MTTCEIHGIDGGERGCPLCITHLTKPKKAPFGTVRHELKKNSASGSGRYIKASDYLKCIGKAKARQSGVCVGLLAGIEHDCTEMEWLHVVDQKVLAGKLGPDTPALTDERMGMYGCRFINGSFDEWRGPLRQIDERENLMLYAHPELHTAIAEYELQVEYERKIEGAP
jgi:hypothetical protein